VLIDWAFVQPVATPRLPVLLLSREEKARERERMQVRRAMDAAYEAELILGWPTTAPSCRTTIPRRRRAARVPGPPI
jgi:hypothetical protein